MIRMGPPLTQHGAMDAVLKGPHFWRASAIACPNVRVSLEGQLRHLANSFKHAGEPGCGERRATLRRVACQQNDNGRTCAHPSHSQCCYPCPDLRLVIAHVQQNCP
jgi:hypothetical protein